MKKLVCIIIALLIATQSNAAIVHTATVITPDDQESEVYTWFYLGKIENGSCHFELIIQPTISLILKTGDTVPVDGEEIMQYAGAGFTCATLNFQRAEQARSNDYFILTMNDNNSDYVGSQPSERIVKIN